MIATSTSGPETSVLVASVLAVVGLIALWVGSVQVVVRRRTAELERVQMDLNATINAIPDPLVELSDAGEILAIHSAERGLFHLPEKSEVLSRLEDVLAPAAADKMKAALGQAAANGRSPRQQIEVAKPGGAVWFELSIARREPQNGNGPRYLMLCRDITERKHHEAGILRLNRLYATLSAANKVVASVGDSEEMLAQICRLAVTSGEMRLAWVGMIEPLSRRIRPVAWFGNDSAYLAGLEINLDPEDPKGQGPFAIALRDNHPCWISDFMTEASCVPWHEQAIPYGWGAAAFLPLHRDGVVIGGLGIYANETDSFDVKSQQLLLDMVGDIDVALDRLSLEAAHVALEDAVKVSEEKFREITESTHEVIWSLDPETLRYLYVSPSVLRLQGFTAEEVMARPFGEALGGEAAERLKGQISQELAQFSAGLRSSDIVSIDETELLSKDGSRVWTESVTKMVRNKRTGRVELHGVTRDITERKFAKEQIERLAFFDPLTGLANRTLLQDRIRNGLEVARRSNLPLALLVLDLDNFKHVNDNLGHAIGDRVLLEMAKRLKANLADADTLAHTGGDEFVVVLPDSDTTATLAMTERLRTLVAMAFSLGAEPLYLTASVGIAMFPDDGTTPEQLMSNANMALHQVKIAGRNGLQFFTPNVQERSIRALQLTNALHQAIQRGELSVEYQPQFELSSNRIFGAEALVRWTHSKLGPVSPAEFIPLAEMCGLILPISQWVMCVALQDASAWMELGSTPLTVSVNISALQFDHGDLVSMVIEELDAEGFPPDQLELELTESVTLADPEKALAQMEQLYALGIRLAIDDFGTGYSSLSYLKKIHAHRLKIDQSFIRDLVSSEDDRAIVVTIINLARSMGMRTIAEGVETPEQLALLRDLGCDEVQGYLLSRPLPQAAFL
ncbi:MULTISPECIES: EAL domain-containing protein [unclassified Cyanobium]|uniref:sensor domain-containing protein n=1 Tax=unclassified Cyanobium TaxID=2627006 RepID=UPI0020CDE599|nr:MULTISPECIES: EAL domain-containing protein [unclassified Cyanobium]MCP9832712.1 EAL domain-containing protein [Cyanobium sp. La Preciosa 7G6]MCP9935463.1 EAL domain-containing protein [Cyanobium sp. Aljojuca 7A6]